MRSLWRIFGVAYEELTFFRRQWMWIVQSLLMVGGISLLASAWGGLEALGHMAVALLVTGGWGVGLNVAGQSIGYDRVFGEYERRVASPLTPAEYILGYLLGASIPFLLSELPLVLLLAVLAGISLARLAAVLLLSVAAMFLGLFLSLSVILRIKNPMNVSAVTNPLYTLTTVLPPVYYSPLVLPEPLRSLSAAAPTVVLVDLGRALVGQANAYPLWVSELGTAAWLVATFMLMLRKLEWGLG
jgi:ABC-2 type transport system permease protein